MTTSSILKILLTVAATIGLFGFKNYKPKRLTNLTEIITIQNGSTAFYSINEGNQTKIYFAPEYNKVWFDDLDKKYRWDKFDVYDNRYWEYMYNLFDKLPGLAKGQSKSDFEFFDKLTRGQKVFYSVLVFGGDTDNGGIHQFFSNRPEFSFAVLETFRELKLDKLSQDYERCLNEFFGYSDSYVKRKQIIDDPTHSWEKKFKSFKTEQSEIKTSKTIEDYFYKLEFKRTFYKTVVNYIDNHLEQFVRK